MNTYAQHIKEKFDTRSLGRKKKRVMKGKYAEHVAFPYFINTRKLK